MMMMVPQAARGPRRHPARARGLLPLPRAHAGAVGRAGGARLLRRHDARRDGRPQRPAPGPLADHRRRLAGDGLGVRHLHDPRGEGLPQGPLPPRASSSCSTSTRAPSTPTARSSSREARRHPYGEWDDAGDQALRRHRGARAAPGRAAPSQLRRLAFGYTQEDLQDPARAARRTGEGADRLDGQRRLARRLQRARAVAVQLLQAALRAGHQPGDRSGARGRRDVADDAARREGQAARRSEQQRLLPDRDRPADPHQRRHRPAPQRRRARAGRR